MCYVHFVHKHICRNIFIIYIWLDAFFFINKKRKYKIFCDFFFLLWNELLPMHGHRHWMISKVCKKSCQGPNLVHTVNFGKLSSEFWKELDFLFECMDWKRWWNFRSHSFNDDYFMREKCLKTNEVSFERRLCELSTHTYTSIAAYQWCLLKTFVKLKCIIGYILLSKSMIRLW